MLSEEDCDRDNALCDTAPAPIWFNNSQYRTWREAYDKCVQLIGNGKPGSVWRKVRIERENADDKNSAFTLKCMECGTKCQLRNPGKWKSEHTANVCNRKANQRQKGVGAL